MRKPNPYRQSLKLLEQLQKQYPTFTLGRHLATALADYGDFWGISDKEFHYAVLRYQALLDVDNMSISEPEIERILKEAEDLDHILDEEEDDLFK